MNDKARNTISKIFEKIYYYLALSLVFIATFVAGLGIFGFAASHILSYKIYEKLSRERYKEKVKFFKIFKETAVDTLISFAKMSSIYVALLIILAVDLFYFSTRISALFTGLFYLGLIISFIIINAMIVSFFIKATYPDIEGLELVQNAVSIVVVNIVDILVLDIAIGLIAYFLAKISFILVLLLVPGIYIELTYLAYKRMIKKRSITSLLFNIKL